MKNITFVNAGAGSGKTFHLTKMLANTVSQGKCRADEVILTTFTEKAATEFKNKARETLLSIGDPQQASLLASAAMGTVHSVAFQLIQKYWHYLGVGVKQRVMPEDDKLFFLNQSLAFVPNQEELDQLSRLTKSLNFVGDFNLLDFDHWKNDLRTIIQLALNNCIDNLDGCKEDSLHEIDEVLPMVEDWRVENGQIAQVIAQLMQNLRNSPESATNNKRITKTEKLIHLNGNFGLEDYFVLRSLFDDLTNGQRNAIPTIDGIRNQLALLHRSPLLVNAVKQYVELLFTLSKRSLKELERYKREHKLIDFNDMEVLFLELLKIPEVANEISGRYKMVFVDEFQDSSPIQVEIFSKLSEIVEHSYWVGDPKQAIYNFRGTDPRLIDAIIKELTIADERNFSIENLNESWRSRPQIVNLTNHIFTEALADQVNREYIALNPIRTALELPDNDRHKALQHWHFTDTISSGTYASLGHHLASEIRQIIQDKAIEVVDKSKSRYHRDPTLHKIVKRGLKPEDVAILCGLKDRIETYTGCLKKLGLEVAAEQNKLADTAEMKLFMALLNYHLDKNDTLAKATIILLSTPGETTAALIDQRLIYLYGPEALTESVGVDADQADALQTAWYEYLSDWGTENELLVKADQIRDQSGHLSVRSLAEKMITLTGLTDLVIRWDNPTLRKNNLQAMKKLAVQYEDRCLLMDIGSSVRGFIEYLSVYDNPALKQGAAAGVSAVNIMTYHKSKGLEWPIVVLTDLDEQHLTDKKLINRTFFGVHLDNNTVIDLAEPFRGKTIIALPWPFGSVLGNVPTDLRNTIVETDRYKRILESAQKEMKRLLYVGMTRARDILITTSYRNKLPNWMNELLGHQNLNTQIIGLAGAIQEVDLFDTGDTVSARLLDYGEDAEYPQPEQRTVTVYEKAGPVDQNNPMFRNPSQAETLADAKVSIACDFNFRISRGKNQHQDHVTGDCLHSLFYLYHHGMPVDSFIPQATEVIHNFGLQGDFTIPGQIHTAASNLYRFLTETYGMPVQIYKELPLQMAEGDIVYTGNADLVWETEDSLILVDYKSYSGQKAHLTDPEHEQYAGKYSGQLDQYRKMIDSGHPRGKKVVKTLLYYAVMGLVV